MGCDLKLTQAPDKAECQARCVHNSKVKVFAVYVLQCAPINLCSVLLLYIDLILRTLGEGTFGKVVCCEDR